MDKASLKPWDLAMCSQLPGQLLVGGARLWAEKMGSLLQSSSVTISIAPAPRIQGLLV